MTNALHDARPTTWAPDDSTFGARLALVRQHMRWGNVAEAARQCGLPIESWRNWEEGKRPRDLVEVAKAISDRTGCDARWLVMGPTREALLRRAEHTGQNNHPAPIGQGRPAPDLLPVLHARIVPGLAAAIRHGDGRRRRTTDPTSAVGYPTGVTNVA